MRVFLTASKTAKTLQGPCPTVVVDYVISKSHRTCAIQRGIESHSKIVSAVLKLCEHLQGDAHACSSDGEVDALQLVAFNLERRWHAIWLQSLEWQCRIEEAIPKGNSSVSRKDHERPKLHREENVKVKLIESSTEGQVTKSRCSMVGASRPRQGGP